MIIGVTVSVCRLLGFEKDCFTRVTVTVSSGDGSWVTTGKTKLFSDALEFFFFCLCTRLFCMIFFSFPPQKRLLGITVCQVTRIFHAALSVLSQETLLLVISEPVQICCVISVILGVDFKARRIPFPSGINRPRSIGLDQLCLS